MKFNQVYQSNFEENIINLFNYYPAELIEAALLPLLAKENDYCIDEPMNITHIFYAELNDIIQRCLIINQQEQLKCKIKHSKNLRSIIQTLKALVPVAYVFCKVPDHDYANLHVVVSQHEYKPFDEIRKAVDFCLLAYPKITCVVHAYGTIKDLITKGHFYYSNLCTQENCIYQQHTTFTLPLANNQLLENNKIKTATIFFKNIDKAFSFFEGAKRFLKNNEVAMCAFMLQQACEFAYRGLITAYKGKDIKTHDLIILRKHIAIYEPKIMGLIDRRIKKEISLLHLLNEAYVKARYDFGYQITDNQLSILLKYTENLLAGVKKIFEQNLNSKM